MRFDYSISHVPAKFLHTADALSLAPIDEIVADDVNTEAVVQVILSLFPCANDCLDEYRKAMQPVLS